MSQTLTKVLPLKPPEELTPFFSSPPLAINEKQEDYDALFAAIAAAAKPADAIAWIYTRDITDLTWEIQRERRLKSQVIRTEEQAVVRVILTPPLKKIHESKLPRIGTSPDKNASEAAWLWANDNQARQKTDKISANLRYEPTDILSKALLNKADVIDAIDKRIATLELRRIATLRTIEAYSEKFARRLEVASSEVINGQFTEAAE